MVTPGPSFLRPGTVASIHRLVGRALQTEQDLQDPQLDVTFRRRHDVSGWVDVLTVQPISIALDNTQVQEGPARAETRKTGTVRIWATFGPTPIQQGDRFLWLGHPCVVDLVPPEQMGEVAIDFTMLEDS